MYDTEVEECRRRIALGNSLNTLLNHNPDFRVLILEGLLHDEVLEWSLNINVKESDTIQFLKSVALFKRYLDKVRTEAEQAQIDLSNYMNLIQDGR